VVLAIPSKMVLHIMANPNLRVKTKYRTKIVRNEENPDDWAKKG
jgi:hypothetical protein